jgi:ADP-heptose:LPS heptosyltransferase/predicted SAM-dependent methyltransferase
MAWTRETSCGNEASKCRHRVLPFLRGLGIDLGCGTDRIHHKAIGIDKAIGAGICHDVERLPMFKDASLDFVFSSHCLEDLGPTEDILKEWWRVLKVGGNMVLYLPHKDLYPNVGQPGANPAHLHDFYPEDILKIVKRNFAAKLIRNDVHAEGNEYSFEMILQKLPGGPRLERDLQVTPENACMIIRYGAFGDAIQATPIIRRIKEEGYFTVVQCSHRGAQVLKNNPHIDRLEVLDEGMLLPQDLPGHWEKLAKTYKRFVNLSGIVEQVLLKIKGQPGYDSPDSLRHLICNVNYGDSLHMTAGYRDNAGMTLPELYYLPKEEVWAEKFVRKVKQDTGAEYLILWSLAGSGWNKKYPWAEFVQRTFLEDFTDAAIITVGDESCKILEWDHPRLVKMSGKTTMRQSCLLTRYVDCVVGPETGVLNAASCWDTPKVLMLSHSSKENLSKYWQNTVNITPEPECECHPCHKLVYVLEECPQKPITIEKKDVLRFIFFVRANSGLGIDIGRAVTAESWQEKMKKVPEGPITMEYTGCMALTEPMKILQAMEKFYDQRQKEADNESAGEGRQASPEREEYPDSGASLRPGADTGNGAMGCSAS